jgi:hypothetical protein
VKIASASSMVGARSRSRAVSIVAGGFMDRSRS